jgi:hypothetical protein
MLLISGTHPQRRGQSRAGALCPFIAAKRRPFDGRRSGGYSRHRRPPLCFQHVHAQQPPCLPGTTPERRFFLLVADSMHVHPQQPVNTSLFAVRGSSTLIPLTFPLGNFRFLRSSHSGVNCSYPADAKQRVFYGRPTVHQSSVQMELVRTSFARPLTSRVERPLHSWHRR